MGLSRMAPCPRTMDILRATSERIWWKVAGFNILANAGSMKSVLKQEVMLQRSRKSISGGTWRKQGAANSPSSEKGCSFKT